MRSLLILILLIPAPALALDINGGTVQSCVIEEAVTLTGTLQNCTVYGNSITVDGDSSLSNVIGYNSGGTDVTVNAGITATGLNNCFKDASEAGAGTYSDAGATTLWSTDPLFRAPIEHDFRLKKGSPCAWGGTEISGTDFCGRKMPWKGKPCMGAIQPKKSIFPLGDIFVCSFNAGCKTSVDTLLFLDETENEILDEAGRAIEAEGL